MATSSKAELYQDFKRRVLTLAIRTPFTMDGVIDWSLEPLAEGHHGA